MWDCSTAGWPICINHMLCTLTPWVLNARRSCKDHDTLSSLSFSSSYSFLSSLSSFWPQNFWWMHGEAHSRNPEGVAATMLRALDIHHHHHHQCCPPPHYFLSRGICYPNYYQHRHDHDQHHHHHWHHHLVAGLERELGDRAHDGAVGNWRECYLSGWSSSL